MPHTWIKSLHHIIYTCSLHPDLMGSGRMEPTAEPSNRPQTSCSPLENGGQWERKWYPVLRDPVVCSWPQKSSCSQETSEYRECVEFKAVAQHPHLWMGGTATGKCMENGVITLKILNLFIYKSSSHYNWANCISFHWRKPQDMS